MENKVITERIKQLETEIEQHKQHINLLNRESNRETTQIVSKNGAVVELKKLIGVQEPEPRN